MIIQNFPVALPTKVENSTWFMLPIRQFLLPSLDMWYLKKQKREKPHTHIRPCFHQEIQHGADASMLSFRLSPSLPQGHQHWLYYGIMAAGSCTFASCFPGANVWRDGWAFECCVGLRNGSGRRWPLSISPPQLVASQGWFISSSLTAKQWKGPEIRGELLLEKPETPGCPPGLVALWPGVQWGGHGVRSRGGA